MVIIITKNKISTISANIDASQPWRRSHCDNVIQIGKEIIFKSDCLNYW